MESIKIRYNDEQEQVNNPSVILERGSDNGRAKVFRVKDSVGMAQVLSAINEAEAEAANKEVII